MARLFSNRVSVRGRLAAVAILVSVLATITAPTVVGAPGAQESMLATCDGYGPTRITGPGNGPFTPAFIQGTNQLVLTYIVSYTITSSNGVITGYAERAAPLPADSIRCDFVFGWNVGGVHYALSGYVIGPVVGQP